MSRSGYTDDFGDTCALGVWAERHVPDLSAVRAWVERHLATEAV